MRELTASTALTRDEALDLEQRCFWPGDYMLIGGIFASLISFIALFMAVCSGVLNLGGLTIVAAVFSAAVTLTYCGNHCIAEVESSLKEIKQRAALLPEYEVEVKTDATSVLLQLTRNNEGEGGQLERRVVREERFSEFDEFAQEAAVASKHQMQQEAEFLRNQAMALLREREERELKMEDLREHLRQL